MASYIKTLKEDNGDITYPQTLASAVFIGNSDVETEMGKYVTAEDVASVSPLDWTTIFNRLYPVGSIYMSATMTSAAQVGDAFGGTWVAWGAGRVPVGVDPNDPDFAIPETTDGEKTHTLTTTEIPSHSHGYLDYWSVQGGSGSSKTVSYDTTEGLSGQGTAAVGGGGAHNNLQPYITCFMYKRTA